MGGVLHGSYKGIIMLNIAIIGCGNIGSRHLQGLSRLNESAVIYLVDNLAKSIEVAKERFNEVVNIGKVDQFEVKVRNIAEIEDDIDVAIIATSSLNRAQITKELVLYNKVKYIVFEKFLFQKRTDYTEIQSLLKRNGIKAWTNQWMSSSRVLQEMNSWFENNLKEIIIEGKNWGMACNSVHFLDYLDSVSGRENLIIQMCNIDSKILDSKRSGYFELTGVMTIQSESGIKLTLSSSNQETDGIINIKMFGGKKRLEATLSIGEIRCNYYEGDSEKHSKKYTLPLQSQTTGDTVQNISKNATCSLPSYEQSVKHHLILFDCFEKVFKKGLRLDNVCPIT